MTAIDTLKLEALLDEFATRHAMPGLSFAVVREGAILFEHQYGVGNRETKAPITLQSRFRIASMTKSFCAVAVLQLVDQGRLSLDSRVDSILGQCSSRLAPLRVHQLLAMSGDLPTDDPWADRLLALDNSELQELLETEFHPAGFPLSSYSYSNLGYMVLGQILHRSSGIPACELVVRSILEPLGLHGTGWQSESEHDVCGYSIVGESYQTEPKVLGGDNAALFGGLWSTIPDLAVWLAFLSGRTSSKQYDAVLSPESRLLLQGPHTSMPTTLSYCRDALLVEQQRYGYGLRQSLVGGQEYFSHSGGLPGFGSHMRWRSQDGLAVLALSNLTYCPVWDLCRDVLAELTVDRTSVASEPPSFAAVVQQRLCSYLLGESSFDSVFATNVLLDTPLLAAELRSVQTALAATGHSAISAASSASSIALGGLKFESIFSIEERAVVCTYACAPTGEIQAFSLDWIEGMSERLRALVSALHTWLDCRDNGRGPLSHLTEKELRHAVSIRSFLGGLVGLRIIGSDGSSYLRLRVNGAEERCVLALKIAEVEEGLGFVTLSVSPW